MCQRVPRVDGAVVGSSPDNCRQFFFWKRGYVKKKKKEEEEKKRNWHFSIFQSSFYVMVNRHFFFLKDKKKIRLWNWLTSADKHKDSDALAVDTPFVQQLKCLGVPHIHQAGRLATGPKLQRERERERWRERNGESYGEREMEREKERRDGEEDDEKMGEKSVKSHRLGPHTYCKHHTHKQKKKEEEEKKRNWHFSIFQSSFYVMVNRHFFFLKDKKKIRLWNWLTSADKHKDSDALAVDTPFVQQLKCLGVPHIHQAGRLATGPKLQRERERERWRERNGESYGEREMEREKERRDGEEDDEKMGEKSVKSHRLGPHTYCKHHTHKQKKKED
jgi:hypothetical protein